MYNKELHNFMNVEPYPTKPLFYCDVCGEEIYEGTDYYRFKENRFGIKRVCCDCVESEVAEKDEYIVDEY